MHKHWAFLLALRRDTKIYAVEAFKILQDSQHESVGKHEILECTLKISL